MKTILRELAHRKTTEAGFALPAMLGLGLVALLLASTLILRSQDDRVAASIQQKADISLNVTEAGVTKIQSFLNNNRLLAVYNSQAWVTQSNTNATANQCSDIFQTDLVASVTSLASGTWQSVDASDPGKGEYKLVSYTYIPNDVSRPQSLPGKGELIVDGRLSDGQSINRLKVTIPVLDAAATTTIPGLWLTNGTQRNNGEIRATDNNEIQANVLINDCRVDLSSIRVTSPYTARYTIRSFPHLPNPPNPVLNTLSTNSFNGGSDSRNLVLPRLSDLPITRTVNGQTVQVYEYWVASDLRIPQNGSLTIMPGQRVTLHLNGNLNNPSGGDIFHDCAGVADCKPTNLQIFGHGAAGSKICLNGNDRIYAFILAPNYTAGVAGAGSSGGFYGAVWTKEWSLSGSCGSNTTNAVLHQTANWNIADLGLDNFIVPKLDRISTWERQQVQ